MKNIQFTRLLIHAIQICLLLSSLPLFSQNDSIKVNLGQDTISIKGVTIDGRTPFITQKADRTIYDFQNQLSLHSGSLRDGLKKIPGLIVSNVAGLSYHGKALDVYLDGRALGIDSDQLLSYLQSVPAITVSRVEIITHPGAEFPATSGDAILNIITSQKKSQKYLSVTYSGGYAFTHYSKTRSTFYNNLLMSGKTGFLSWQIRTGQNYEESWSQNHFYNSKNSFSQDFDRTKPSYQTDVSLKFLLNSKDFLLFNYRTDVSLSRAASSAIDINHNSIETKHRNRNNLNDFLLKYQKSFEGSSNGKLSASFEYQHNFQNVLSKEARSFEEILNNDGNQGDYTMKIDYSQGLPILDKTKLIVGVLQDRTNFTARNAGIKNFTSRQNTLSEYAQFDFTKGKYEMILGGRLESYSLKGVSTSEAVFKRTSFFPNATLQYNFLPQVYLNASYARKIGLPSMDALNPNNTHYQSPNISFTGNPNLKPTIFNNYSMELSAFQYAYVGFSVKQTSNDIVNRFTFDDQNDLLTRGSINIPKSRITDLYVGFPIPLLLFTEGLKKTLEFNFDQDEVSFLNLYFDYTKYHLPDITSRGVWYINILAQIILPENVQMNASYGATLGGGNQYYNKYIKPIQSLDISFAREFLHKNLSISLYANDLFNNLKQTINFIGTDLNYISKGDSQQFGLSLNYKIPLKSKKFKDEDIDQINQNDNAKKHAQQPVVN